MSRQGSTIWILVPAIVALLLSCLPVADGSATPWLIGTAGLVVFAAATFVLASRDRREPTPSPRGGAVALCETLRLSNQNRLHVVRFRSTILLLGETDQGLRVLDAATDGRDLLPTAAIDEGADLRDTPSPETGRAARRTVAEMLDQGTPVVSRSAVAAASLAEFKDRLHRARARDG